MNIERKESECTFLGAVASLVGMIAWIGVSIISIIYWPKEFQPWSLMYLIPAALSGVASLWFVFLAASERARELIKAESEKS